MSFGTDSSLEIRIPEGLDAEFEQELDPDVVESFLSYNAPSVPVSFPEPDPKELYLPEGSPFALAVQTKFKVGKLLGEGGFGAVFEATEIAHPGKKVALKIISSNAGFESPEDLQRNLEDLKNEKEYLQNVENEHILKCLGGDVGVENGYIELELIEGGKNFGTIIGDSSMQMQSKVSLLAQVTDGLSAMHEAGIIHKDIKDTNIYVAETNGDHVAKLADFGIATDEAKEKKLREDFDAQHKEAFDEGQNLRKEIASLQDKLKGEQDSDVISRLDLIIREKKNQLSGLYDKILKNKRESQFIIGTPGCLSPEQIKGEDVTKQSDIFSLGILFYKTVTFGRNPFEKAAIKINKESCYGQILDDIDQKIEQRKDLIKIFQMNDPAVLEGLLANNQRQLLEFEKIKSRTMGEVVGQDTNSKKDHRKRIDKQIERTKDGAKWLKTVIDSPENVAVTIQTLKEQCKDLLSHREDQLARVEAESFFAAIQNHEPTPAIDVNPNISPELNKLILRMLSKHPEARPTAIEVHDALVGIEFVPAVERIQKGLKTTKFVAIKPEASVPEKKFEIKGVRRPDSLMTKAKSVWKRIWKS